MSRQNESRSTPERRILGELGNSTPDSPTANLRLLTTLASNLKNVTYNPCQGCSSSSSVVELPPARDSNCMKLLPRKEKSLSLLCNKFLNLFPLTIEENARKEISLNTTAQALGTEKRRIYDIINVLESLEMASKAGKNQYFWHGQSRLPMTLAKLKMSAIELGLKKQIQEIQKINRAYLDDSGRSCNNYSTTLMVPQSPVVDYRFPDNSVKEDKSLGVMCRKFVMLFLVSLKNGVINLDIAAKVLINEQDNSVNIKSSTTQSRYKTKVRRLYDIANVLSAIGLIEKVDLYNCIIRKPIFKYTGPSIDCINFDSEILSTENESQSLVGMTTPNKKSNVLSYHALSRISRLYSSTPIGNKREPRKRKLFDSDNKFNRTQSSSNLSKSETRSLDRLDDSILQVVEMELKRMKSNEHKPKVCTKLFPRHNSDSCISPSKEDINLGSAKLDNVASTIPEVLQISTTDSPVALPVVSKENLVNESCKLVTPIRTVRINVPLELKITPFKLQECNTPKFVKLTNFDMKKLVPISKEDIKIKLASVNSTEKVQNPIHKPNVAIMTQIPIKKISAGDIFKAIKVGNTFQLVPIEHKSDSNQKN
ncbi:PREDICTED: transcription factor E2F8-like [Ceratosolen solmsi marchali]|uniref:Transcription factor E2F8-like n=1 Tax=Ceratosolen solmsi marchali TaxID=326594 RepID=A0AAJ6YHW5_9HYME|nr:PREDICTED: transcription factor E2F8-like [Ceratosolen solmsi marchali]